MSAKKQCGGGEDRTKDTMAAPISINVVDYAGARAREMEAMARVSRRTWGNNLVLQTLPRHMRRRAASHNVKRIPRRLRNKAEREMERSGKSAKSKAPSRTHRRRPGNLLHDYSRRARQNVWLETHIWHAKRFHLANKWGYRVPLHPNDKGVRAAYRGAARFCIMQDISYTCCLELKGPQNELLAGLAQLCSPEVGLTPAAVKYIKGSREGEFILYRHGQYPIGAIGQVKFLWRPLSLASDSESTGQELQRHLWLWVHPGCYESVLRELKVVYNMQTQIKKEETTDVPKPEEITEQKVSENKKDLNNVSGKKQKRDSTEKDKKTVDDVRPRPQDNPSYTNGRIELKSLKDLLCRFCLKGPLSQSILEDLLKVADVEGVKSQCGSGLDTNGSGDGQGAMAMECEGEQESQSVTSNMKTGGSSHREDTSDNPKGPDSKEKWWQGYFSDPLHKSTHELQVGVWEELKAVQSPGELADNVVLGLTVRDPRVFLPQKKMRVADDPADATESVPNAVKQWPSGVSPSAIWEEQIRYEVKASKMPENKLNELRSRHLVPGTQLALGNEESRIPVLLIQNPGVRPRAGRSQDQSSQAGVPLQWGAGWDLVLPQSWAMAFWLGLIFRGARAVGLKESLSTATEIGSLHFPEGFPDTPMGKAHEESEKEELEGKYKRMPPAKRPNYIKLGCIAPFHYPWKLLISDWNPQSVCSATNVDTLVLRNKHLLRQLDETCSGAYKQQNKVRKSMSQHLSVHDAKGDSKDTVYMNLSAYGSFLIAVHVRATQRGVMEPFSMICIAKAEDLEVLRKDKKYAGPLEPPHIDPHNAKRKKGDQQKTNDGNDKKPKEAKATKKTMGLCEKVENARDSSSRPVIGYVKQGGYHLCDGRGAGVGFVVVRGLVELLKEQNNTESSAASHSTVLVRCPRSNQYRFATLSIVV